MIRMKIPAQDESSEEINVRRRHLLTIPVVMFVTTEQDKVLAQVQQAVGSGESNCRVNNNCLEMGEWDGAIGWGWGGKDRCDPTDPRCGTDGRLRETPIIGQPVPLVPSIEGVPIRFTYVAAVQIEIGRNEIGVLKMGFYGNEAPGAVQQMVSFLSDTGFTALSASESSSFLGRTQPAVSLQRGGIVTSIVPNTAIEFGVPLQSVAYARSLGRSKVDESFVPQPRPQAPSSLVEKYIRPHDSAGLISIPVKGLGYGGTGFESDDECYESAFLVTARSDRDLDKQNRIVIGQILDAESMAFLERLANVPTKRGIRGVIPGQTSGPPLPKVVVRQIQVSRVSSP